MDIDNVNNININDNNNTNNNTNNNNNDNYLCGTMVKGHDGLFYLPVFELEQALNSWLLDKSIEKSMEKKQAYWNFTNMIPIKTNYSIVFYGIDRFFSLIIGYCPHYIEDKPFGKSQIPISHHLRYFRSGYKCMGYHKIVLSKEQYDCLLYILNP